MRPRMFLTLFLALGLGAVAVFLARYWLESQARTTSEDVRNGSVRRVVVAAAPLRFGTELSNSNLSEIDWPTGAIPRHAFSSKEKLLAGEKRVVLSAIAQNEPILQTKITGPGQRASLSALISKDDMKAVTIRVNEIHGVAGFVLPGERVDVLITRIEQTRRDGESIRRQFTDVLMENVKVLAVDQVADDRTEKPKPAKAVTVEVNTVDAQKLVLASTAGTLSLVLRRAGAVSAIGNRRVTLGDLGITSARGEKPDEKKVIEVDPRALVGVVRGVKRDEVAVPRRN